jgi:uncharacterized protein (DUF3820 family)
MKTDQLMNASQLTARITGRKAGAELVELILSEASTHPMAAAWPEEFAQAMFAEIHKAMTAKLPQVEAKPDRDAPMTYEEAREWERRTLEFGKHQGEFVKDVPLEYLLWIDGDKFRGELKRYLASPLVQGQQVESEEPEVDEP